MLLTAGNSNLFYVQIKLPCFIARSWSISEVHFPEWHLRHCNEIPFIYSQKRNCAASVQISTFMCLWGIYVFPGSVHIFSCGRIDRPIVGIFKLLTDTWMRKLGLRLRNFFSRNICFEFSVLCLCNDCRWWNSAYPLQPRVGENDIGETFFAFLSWSININRTRKIFKKYLAATPFQLFFF